MLDLRADAIAECYSGPVPVVGRTYGTRALSKLLLRFISFRVYTNGDKEFAKSVKRMQHRVGV